MKLPHSSIGNAFQAAINPKQVIKRILSQSLYRNSLYLMTDVAITSAFGFLFWLVAARLYSESDVGAGSAIISAVNLLTVFSTLGLTISIIRFLPYLPVSGLSNNMVY